MPPRRKLVTLTRTESGNQAWAPYLQAQGIPVYHLPTIETALLPLSAHTTTVLKQLADFDWLILTSATAVRCLQTLLEQAALTVPKSGLRIAAIGSQTARALEQAGFTATFQPSKPDSRTLGAELVPVAGQRILLLRTTITPEELAAVLRARGGIVTTVPLYETRILDTPDGRFASLLQEGLIGCLTFASPSAVEGFGRRIAEPHLQDVARELPTAAIGPTVAAALARHGFRHVYTSSAPSAAGIMEILQQLGRQAGNDLL